MGYGYAVWLVYNQEIFRTEHVSHFTVACFLNEISAFDLFIDLKEKLEKDTLNISLNGDSKVFSQDYYTSDTNGLFSWGYNGVCTDWDDIREVCSRHDCCFSETPHTSIYYDICLETLQPLSTTNKIIPCKLYMADARNDNPKFWSIIGN